MNYLHPRQHFDILLFTFTVNPDNTTTRRLKSDLPLNTVVYSTM